MSVSIKKLDVVITQFATTQLVATTVSVNRATGQNLINSLQVKVKNAEVSMSLIFTDFCSCFNSALKINLNFCTCSVLLDINECTENQSICGLNAVCYNNIGSYHCMCAPGFVASNGQEHFNASQKVTCNGEV